MIYYNTLFKNGHKNRQQPQQQHKSTISSSIRGSTGSHHYHHLTSSVLMGRIVAVAFVVILIVLGYIYIRIVLLHVTTHIHSPTNHNGIIKSTTTSQLQQQQPKKKPSILATFLTSLNNNQNQNHTSKEYHVNYFRQMAIELAKYTPSEILYELNTYDPFGVRKVIQQIQNMEFQNQNQSISLVQIQTVFPCPTISNHHRITYPDLRNRTKLDLYQQQMQDILTTSTTEKRRRTITTTDNYFIYFQHLRKAGGTHFCTLAQQNIPLSYVPKYYCMPDYYWLPPQSTKKKQNQNQEESSNYVACAGCLHRYSTNEIIQNMKLYKIAGNEWDNFHVPDHFHLPAIYITSFRQPLHRFVSQYRFECVEARGCTAKTIDTYWKRRRDLYNIYTSTFSDVNLQASFAFSTQTSAAEQRANSIAIAYDTIVQFHLVLVMELLPYSEQLVQNVLRFRDTSILSKRVRPHNNGKNHRTDSWTPEQYLTKEQYTKMSESLALDEILYDVARRIFLERLVCAAPQ